MLHQIEHIYNGVHPSTDAEYWGIEGIPMTPPSLLPPRVVGAAGSGEAGMVASLIEAH
jgi:hypothetical protein